MSPPSIAFNSSNTKSAAPSHEEIMMKLGSPTTSSPVIGDDLGGAELGRRPSATSRPEFISNNNNKPKLTLTGISSSDEDDYLSPPSPIQPSTSSNFPPLSVISEASDNGGNQSGSDSDASSNAGNGGGTRKESTAHRSVERLRLSREHTRISDNVAVKSGYLMKKGERRKAWKKRWFVLRGAQVAMYKNDKEYRLLRLIPLSEIHNCAPIELKKHSFAFGIVTPDRTTYVKASSDREVQEWCSAVERAKEEVKASLTITSIETPTDTPRGESTPLAHSNPSAAIPISIAPISSAGGSNLGAVAESYNTGTSPSPPTPFSYTANSMLSSSFTSTSTAPHDPHGPGSRVPPNSFALGPAPALGNSSSRHLEGNNHSLELGGVDAGLTRIVERQYREQQMSGRSGSGGESSGGEYGPRRRVVTLSPPMGGGYSLTRSLSSQSNNTAPPLSPSGGGLISSSEDEDGVNEGNESWLPTGLGRAEQLPQQNRSPVIGSSDPSKIIMSGYLMKQGKRRNWRKRWFVLMSGSLSYQRSHMDGKIHQQIPLSEILDALEFTPPSSSNLPSSSSRRPLSSSGPLSPGSTSIQAQQTEDGKKNYEHCFKIITPKRTYLVCAATEEEEIKWLAALQYLVARKAVAGIVGASGNGNVNTTGGGRRLVNAASSKERGDGDRVVGGETGRHRSYTDAARAAVRDVESRFHSIERMGRT